MNRPRKCGLPYCKSALLLVILTTPLLFADSIGVTDVGAAVQTATGYTGRSLSLYMNSSGQVAGKIYTSTVSTTFYAFLYSGGTVQNIGTFTNPTGGTTAPLAINSSGEVVGQAFNSTSAPQGFLYESGILSDLGEIGGTNSTAYGVTDSGMVVGKTTLASGNSNSDVFIYSNGTMTDIGRPTGAVNIGSDMINNSGQIAGNSDASGGQAFYYDSTNGFQAITLGGTSTAVAIGVSGQVIGQANANGYQQAFLYDPTSNTTTDLGTAWAAGDNNPVTTSDATAINANGEIVGQANVSTLNYHATIFSNGVMTDLGVLPGYVDSTATAVNDNGWVVGYDTTSGGSQTAFLYIPPSTGYPDGDMINLSSLLPSSDFTQLLTATGINDLDQIIGQGQTSTTANAYILNYYSSVPEPSTGVFMTFGLLLCSLGFLKHRLR